MSKEDSLRDALRSVVDPEIGMNIVELGLVREFVIGVDSVHVGLILRNPFCP